MPDVPPLTLDVLRINPLDNVCVAMRPLGAGLAIRCEGVAFTLSQPVPLGGKLALAPLPAGSKVVKFGEPIGTLTADVPLGGYIHTHNLESDYLHTHANGERLG